jgi:hypothetical protein
MFPGWIEKSFLPACAIFMARGGVTLDLCQNGHEVKSNRRSEVRRSEVREEVKSKGRSEVKEKQTQGKQKVAQKLLEMSLTERNMSDRHLGFGINASQNLVLNVTAAVFHHR